MRKMKHSGLPWIQEIPDSWSLTKIKYIAEVVPGATPKSSVPEYWDGEIPFITPADYVTEDHYISYGSRSITTDGMNSCSTSLLPIGSIIVSTRAPIGPVVINSIPICTNQGCKGLVQRSKFFNFEYLDRLLSIAEDALIALGNGTTYQELSGRSLANFKIPKPSLQEQNAIVSYIVARCAPIDEAISRHRQAIDKLEEYRRAIISCVIGGRAEEVDSSGWTWKRFKFIARVDSNLVEPNKYANWLHIAPDAIGKGNGKLLQKHTVSEDGVVSSNHLFRKGAILYSKVRPRLNKVVVAPDDGLCSADMYPISTTQNVEWLKFYMLSDQFVEQAGLVSDIRIKMPKINKQELGDIKILVPPPNVQLEIVSRLNAQCYAIDEAIGRQNQIIDKLVEYRRSLIHVAVTGQIDCTKEPL